MSLKPPETRSAVLETLLLQKVFAGAGSLSNDGMRASGSDAFSTFGFRGEALSAICAMGDMTKLPTSQQPLGFQNFQNYAGIHAPFAALPTFRSIYWARCLHVFAVEASLLSMPLGGEKWVSLENRIPLLKAVYQCQR